MPTKYNWEQLKTDYFLSPIMDVSSWGRQFFGSTPAVKSGNFYQCTKNWRKDKEEYQKDLQQKTLAQIRHDRIANYIRLQDKVFTLIDSKLTSNISVKDLQMLWQMIMTSQGLPTRVSETPVQESEQGPKTLAEAFLAITQKNELAKRAQNIEMNRS